MSEGIGSRWTKVIIAGVLTEISVVVVIGVIVVAYRLGASPTDAEFQAFIARVGSALGVYGGGVAALLFALWATRGLTTDFIVTGLLVGAIAALLHMVFMLGSGSGLQIPFVIADGLKIIGGALGGLVAQQRAARMR